LQKLSPRTRIITATVSSPQPSGGAGSAPDLELNVLQSIEDVTAAVNEAVKPDMTPAQAFARSPRHHGRHRRKESLAKTGLRSDVVTLYHGGLYHLYRYKKYTDVRLVMAPGRASRRFGGDVDNFELSAVQPR